MRKLLAPLAIVGLLVSCGGDDSDVTPSTEAASTEETTTEAPAEESTDIVAIASGNEDFSTLVAAVAAAGLVETLQGEGPFTAFAALPAGLVDKLLLPENKDLLVKILTYHVVSGTVLAADVTAGDVPTVEGQNITITTDMGVKVNGATVTATDIIASNGVIHVIDAVILPPDVDPSAL